MALAARPLAPRLGRPTHRPRAVARRAYKVTIQQDGKSTELMLEEGETVLQAGLDAGLDLPHDCKMGVCMRCSSRLVSGDVDQSAGMLDDVAQGKGYLLSCVAEPASDCVVAVIDEDELLEEVLQAAKSTG